MSQATFFIPFLCRNILSEDLKKANWEKIEQHMHCSIFFYTESIYSYTIIKIKNALDGTWTHTQKTGHEPESCAYANSATSA